MDQDLFDDSMDEVIARNIEELREIADPNSLRNLERWEQEPEEAEWLALMRNLEWADIFDEGYEDLHELVRATTERQLDLQRDELINPDSNIGKRRRVDIINQDKRRRREEMAGSGITRINLNKPSIEFIEQASASSHLANFNSEHFRGQYQVKHNLSNVDCYQMAGHLDAIFYDLIFPKLQGADPNAFIQIAISHDSLPLAIHLNERVRNFTREMLINRFLKTTQSQREWLLDGSFLLEILITSDRTGGAQGGASKARAPTTVEAEIKSRKCIIEIKNNYSGSENSCGWWAIALGIAKLRNSNNTPGDRINWRAIIQNKKCNGIGRLELAARNFCFKYNFNYTTRLGAEQYEAVDRALAPEFQLVVVINNGQKYVPAYIASGNLAHRQIYILLENDHFNLITKIAALYRAQYFCPKHWVYWKEN